MCETGLARSPTTEKVLPDRERSRAPTGQRGARTANETVVAVFNDGDGAMVGSTLLGVGSDEEATERADEPQSMPNLQLLTTQADAAYSARAGGVMTHPPRFQAGQNDAQCSGEGVTTPTPGCYSGHHSKSGSGIPSQPVQLGHGAVSRHVEEVTPLPFRGHRPLMGADADPEAPRADAGRDEPGSLITREDVPGLEEPGVHRREALRFLSTLAINEGGAGDGDEPGELTQLANRLGAAVLGGDGIDDDIGEMSQLVAGLGAVRITQCCPKASQGMHICPVCRKMLKMETIHNHLRMDESHKLHLGCSEVQNFLHCHNLWQCGICSKVNADAKGICTARGCAGPKVVPNMAATPRFAQEEAGTPGLQTRLAEQLTDGALISTAMSLMAAPHCTPKHIPKKSRTPFLEMMVGLLKNVNRDPSIYNLVRLLCGTKCMLSLRLPGSGVEISHGVRIKERIESFGDSRSSFLGIIDTLMDEKASVAPPPRPLTNSGKAKKALIIAKVGDGQLSAACKIATSAGVAPMSLATLAKMQEKNPERGMAITSTGFIDVNVTIKAEEIEKSINSFKKGSAPGPDGVRPDFLKMCQSSTNTFLKESFGDEVAALANLAANGKLPLEAQPLFNCGKAVALRKGDSDVRPLVVGNTFSRLISKTLVQKNKEKIEQFFGNRQVAFRRGGCEIAVHAAQTFLENNRDDDNVATVLFDFKNAYNNVFRELMLQAFKKHFPELYNWVKFRYGQEGACDLFLGEFLIKNSEGGQQGCPLAGIGFCLVLNELLDEMESHGIALALVLQLWYMDDGLLAGAHSELSMAIEFIKVQGEKKGMFLNLSKCVVFHSRANTAVWDTFYPPEMIRVVGGGIKYLGALISLERDYCEGMMDKSLDKIQAILVEVIDLGDAQTSNILLRFCTGYPKLVHLVQTTHTRLIEDGVKRADEMMFDAYSKLLGAPLTREMKIQLGLPIAPGFAGFGIHSVAEMAGGAYVKSLSRAIPFLRSVLPGLTPREHEYALDIVANSANIDINILKDAFNNQCISSLNIPLAIHTFQRDSLLNGLIDANKYSAAALMRSAGGEHAGDFLNAVPVQLYGTKLSNRDFITAALYRLNARQYPISHTKCICGAFMDPYGHHATRCATEGLRIAKHNLVVDAIYELCTSACLLARKEVKYLFPDDSSRPADILIDEFHYSNNSLLFDIGITDPTASDICKKASMEANAAGQKYKATKMAKYATQLEGLPYVYEPLIIENPGSMSAETVKYIDQIAEFAAVREGIATHEMRKRIYTKISVKVQKANAMMIAARAPAG